MRLSEMGIAPYIQTEEHSSGIRASVVEYSQYIPTRKRILTFSLRYHRFIHGEVMTHRVFSRNAMSSRAVPIRKILAQVWKDPAMPVHWGATQAGMQAHSQLSGWRLRVSRGLWRGLSKVACVAAWGMMKCNLAKQVANRVLEPWQWMHTVVTATEWDNFYDLRMHPDAQPEFQVLANCMWSAMNASKPRGIMQDMLGTPYGWHLPYITGEEREHLPLVELIKMSAARCARVSYLTHEGTAPVLAKDLDLFDRLVGSEPLHASPIEHQATPAQYSHWRSGNFVGWHQFRQAYTPGGVLSDLALIKWGDFHGSDLSRP